MLGIRQKADVPCCIPSVIARPATSTRKRYPHRYINALPATDPRPRFAHLGRVEAATKRQSTTITLWERSDAAGSAGTLHHDRCSLRGRRCRACAVEATELARRAAKPLPPRVIAFVTELNTTPGAVTDEDLNRLQIRGTDTYSRIRLPELLPLVDPAIVAQAQAAFPDAPASQAVVLRWHLRGLMLLLALRKAALSAQIEAQKPGRNGSA